MSAKRDTNGSEVAIREDSMFPDRLWREDFDRFFDDAFKGFGMMPFRNLWRSPWTPETPVWNPGTDVLVKDDNLIVRIDIPGMKAEDIHVTVEDGRLCIRGRREEEAETRAEDYYRAERTTGDFTRAITLPEGADIANMAATYKNGVLEVKAPCVEKRAKDIKTIEVK